MDKAARIAELTAELRKFTLSRLDAFEDAHSGHKTPRKETLFVLADILEKPVLELKSEWHRATAGAPLPEEIAVRCREAIELCEALRRAALSAQDFEAAGLKSKIQDMRERRDGGDGRAQAIAQLQDRTRRHIEKTLAKEPDLTRAAIFEIANTFLLDIREVDGKEVARGKKRSQQTLERREWLGDLLPEAKTGPKRR